VRSTLGPGVALSGRGPRATRGWGVRSLGERDQLVRVTVMWLLSVTAELTTNTESLSLGKPRCPANCSTRESAVADLPELLNSPLGWRRWG